MCANSDDDAAIHIPPGSGALVEDEGRSHYQVRKRIGADRVESPHFVPLVRRVENERGHICDKPVWLLR